MEKSRKIDKQLLSDTRLVGYPPFFDIWTADKRHRTKVFLIIENLKEHQLLFKDCIRISLPALNQNEFKVKNLGYMRMLQKKS